MDNDYWWLVTKPRPCSWISGYLAFRDDRNSYGCCSLWCGAGSLPAGTGVVERESRILALNPALEQLPAWQRDARWVLRRFPRLLSIKGERQRVNGLDGSAEDCMFGAVHLLEMLADAHAPQPRGGPGSVQPMRTVTR